VEYFASEFPKGGNPSEKYTSCLSLRKRRETHVFLRRRGGGEGKKLLLEVPRFPAGANFCPSASVEVFFSAEEETSFSVLGEHPESPEVGSTRGTLLPK